MRGTAVACTAVVAVATAAMLPSALSSDAESAQITIQTLSRRLDSAQVRITLLKDKVDALTARVGARPRIGPVGPSGSTGVPGPPGAQGAPGAAGPAGPGGPGGANGANGANGVNGSNGTNGTARAWAIVDVRPDDPATPTIDPGAIVTKSYPPGITVNLDETSDTHEINPGRYCVSVPGIDAEDQPAAVGQVTGARTAASPLPVVADALVYLGPPLCTGGAFRVVSVRVADNRTEHVEYLDDVDFYVIVP